jgi:hypothetical protein
MPNPFDWDYLTTPPASGEVLDAFAVIYLAVFLVGFVVAAYLYYRPWTRPIGRMFRRRAVIKATGVAMWVFGIGLFFFLIRLLQIDPFTFGRPIWMWLSVLAVIGLAVWIGLGWNEARRDHAAAAAAGQPVHTRRGASHAQPARRPVKRKSSLR